MSTKIEIPHNAWIVVADGRKALFLRNEGEARYPNLKVARKLEAEPNPRSTEQGTDRPGRLASGTNRSAVEQTDWHEENERAFAAEVAETLAKDHGGATDGVILAAAPRTLAELRKALPEALHSLILAELDKDLTHLTVHEIERHLSAT
jgi:protein required for attachment to host cells